MWKLSLIKDKFENIVNQYGETTVLLRDATCDQPWGPTTEELKNLNNISFKYDQFGDLMKAIWERIQNPKSSWRQIYKTLLVLDYLVKNGSERVIDDAKQNYYILESLKNREYDDDERKEHRQSISHRSSEIIQTISDSNRLEFERKKAKEYNERMKGCVSIGSSTIHKNSEYKNNFDSSNRIGQNDFLGNDFNNRQGKFSDGIIPPISQKSHHTQYSEQIVKQKDNDLIDLMSFTETTEQKTRETTFDIFDPLCGAQTSTQTQFIQQQNVQTQNYQQQNLITDISFLSNTPMQMNNQNNFNQFCQPGMQQNFQGHNPQNRMGMQGGLMNGGMNQPYGGFQQNNNPSSIMNMSTMNQGSYQMKQNETKAIDLMMSENLMFGKVESPTPTSNANNAGFQFDKYLFQ